MKHCPESDHGVPKFDCYVVRIMCLFYKRALVNIFFCTSTDL